MTEIVPFRMDRKAAEVLIRQIAEDSRNLILSNHAQERMEERDITDIEIFRALRRGHLYEDPERGKKPNEWKCKVVWPTGSGRDIGVVTIIMDRKKLFIKTVEWEDLA